ncbi:MAG TPA: hypothetical protein VNX88_03670 [Terriglobales bacterium]|jgi:hypothetical protein|nr:hypothetical protein [Terriglobales bacterium]
MKKTSIIIALLVLVGTVAFAQEVPKEELYLGYSFLRVNSATIVPAFTANGGIGTIQYNFNKNFAAVADLGGYHNGNISGVQLDSTAFSYLFGPKIMAHKGGRLSPFIETLFGGTHVSRSFALPPLPTQPINPSPAPTGRFANSQSAFAMAIGGGLDMKLGRHIALRPLQLDYFLTRFQPLFFAGLGEVNRDRNQNNLRYSAGLNFMFGGATPPAPIASCSGTPSELLPDDPPVSVSVNTTNFNTKHDLAYNWSSTGGQVTSSGSSAKIDANGLTPGSYTVTSNVTDPKQKKNNSASCTTAFTVRQPQAPTVACGASPSSIQAGSNVPVTLTARGAAPDGRPIKSRNVTSNFGTIKEGSTSVGDQVGSWVSAATLDTSGVSSGPIEVNVAVTDSRGLTGTCVARVDVQPLPAAPAPVTESLVSACNFNNTKSPARVDNECKANLDDVAVRMQKDPGGKVVFVGSADSEQEAAIPQLGAIRAVNAKEYLAAGEGQQQADASRIEVRQGPSGENKVDLYWVPANGNFTVANASPVDEAQVKAVASSLKGKKRKAVKGAPAASGN